MGFSNVTPIRPEVSTECPSKTLLEMLTFRRPAFSKSENHFIKRYLTPLGAESDGFGNMMLRVGDNSRVLWSSHTDTVHKEGGRQSVEYHAQTGVACLPHDSKSNCLGADCSTGVWLMTEMVKRGVPGLYIWHAAEERGGQGSDYISKNTPELLAGIEFAIALDRKDNSEIITHQMGCRMASGAFANSLATLLPEGYSASREGVFTDTANYEGLIGECVNLGVGYAREHTTLEVQHIPSAIRLLGKLLQFDESKLVRGRIPGEPDYHDDFEGDPNYELVDICAGHSPFDTDDDLRKVRTVEDFVRRYPCAVVDIFEQWNVSVSDLYALAPWLERQ